MRGRLESTGDIDGTKVIDRGMPKHWRCPHCKMLQTVGKEADSILMEHGKYIEHCEDCGTLHYWELELTDSFKERTVNMLLDMTARGERWA